MVSDKQRKNIHACAKVHQSLTPAHVVGQCRQLASEGVHRSDCASAHTDFLLLDLAEAHRKAASVDVDQ